MSSFLNTQGVSYIDMNFKMNGFCPLGGKPYTNNFKVKFFPGSTIPDYCDIENEIKKREDRALNKYNPHYREELVIEDAVEFVYNLLMEYGPKKLTVISEVFDAAHFPVRVVKESDDYL